jgi:DNA polymerase sigma
MLYGSQASGLAINSSDVDLAIIGIQGGDHMSSMHQLFDHLNLKFNAEFIPTASIPLIKL